MRPPTVLVQVALLAVAAVIATQLATLSIVALAPAPQPAGFTMPAAVAALEDRPARTADGRTLRRRLDAAPPFDQAEDPFAQALARGLADGLERDPSTVRVRMERPMGGGPPPLPTMIGRWGEARPGRSGSPAPPPDLRIGGLSDQIAIPPFSATVRMDHGLWATIVPPQGGFAPWQWTLLLSMGLSLVLLAPLIWWMAQRLAYPIRRFAQAADRLGADPDAAPLTPHGPAEVRLAVAAFNGMQARLRAHIERRTHTVAAIAHDLRTPLTRLRFRIEAMAPAQQRQAIRDIEEMESLIAQAMQFARGRYEQGQVQILDLGDLVRSVVEQFGESGADIGMMLESGLAVYADAEILRRGLSNLMDNALRHAQAVTVRATSEDGRAVVRIQDQGAGIPADQLEHVFDPFFRLDGSRSRRTGGAGLGLSIARHAMRANGGELVLSNAATGGLVATLSLPLVEDDAGQGARPQQAAAPPPSVRPRKKA